MADFVIGDQALLGAVLQRGGGEPHGDAFEGIAEGMDEEELKISKSTAGYQL